MVDESSTVETYFNRNYNHNSAIEESLVITDNFGHNVRIARREFATLEDLKNIICTKMQSAYNIEYYVANLKLIHPNNTEIKDIGQTEGIYNLRLVIIPVNCNEHL